MAEANDNKNEQTLNDFFAAMNRNDVDAALDCCADNVRCTYPDPGRNWQGKDRGRVVMTAIFEQLAARDTNKVVTYEVAAVDDSSSTISTCEKWGHPNMTIKTTYTFTDDNKIVSMDPMNRK